LNCPSTATILYVRTLDGETYSNRLNETSHLRGFIYSDDLDTQELANTSTYMYGPGLSVTGGSYLFSEYHDFGGSVGQVYSVFWYTSVAITKSSFLDIGLVGGTLGTNSHLK
jgi:hypothetical protein